MKTLMIIAIAAAFGMAGCKEKIDESADKSSHVNHQVDAPKAASESVRQEPKKVPKKWSGPLGVKMGLSLVELEEAGIKLTAVENVPLVYQASSSPAPSSSFDDYVYVVSETTGLCKISAWTPVTETNYFGEQIISTFNDLESALTEKYGKPKTFKFVQNGSLWNESRYFMMGLSKEERTHASAWNTKRNSELPEDIEAIVLNATAFSASKGAVKLTYEFNNSSACVKEAKQKKHSNL